MNPNMSTGHPQQQQHHPHPQQHVAGDAGSGRNAGDNSNVLVYINHPCDDNANQPSGMTLHNCPMSSTWVKQRHPASPGNVGLSPSPSNVNNCPSSTSTSYGAYSQQQTSNFYPSEHSYDESVAEGRPNSNFNPSSTAFYSNDSPDYYHQTPSSQFENFDSTKTQACASDDVTNSNFNFFSCNSNFYQQPSNLYGHDTQEYQSQPRGGKYFRNNYANSVQDPSSYFAGGSLNRASRPGHQHTSQFRDHSLQTTFRRNSIESFSTEPGELAYNAKYGTFSNNSSGLFVPHSKRDSFVSEPWSSISAGNSGGMDQSHCQEYFFPNQNHNPNHRHYSNTVNPLGNSCGSPALPGNVDFDTCVTASMPHHQIQHQQFPNNFNKSCSFEEAGQSACSPHGNSGMFRAASLKHRTLSLPYPRSDQLVNRFDQSQHQMFEIRTNAYSSNTNKSVPGVAKLLGRPNSNPSLTSHSGENEFDSSDCTSNSNNASPVLERIPTPPCQDNASCNENDDDDDDEEEDDPSVNSAVDHIHLDCESNNPTRSNLNELSRFSEDSPTTGRGTNAGSLESDDHNKSNLHNIISTTSSMAESTCQRDHLERDIGNDNDNDLSNSSSLALFDSITLMNTLASPLSDNADDSLSGMTSSESGGGHVHTRHMRDKSPQKISKRSFSEADKDLVINTSAITAAMAFGVRRKISVPLGWKREMNNNNHIHYISPSSTKLRSWEELKNYVSSDGTCKCGLSCPLWLENSFSFDPKVRNTCEDEEESLQNLNGKDVKMETRFCCNHKRKTPSNEDYPIISSTRDDLGDGAEEESDERKGKAKKRRISGSCVGDTSKYIGHGSVLKTPKPSTPSPQSQNVSVPFSQQSPDTTTQTPQRDMSPASSVSSEQSSGSAHSSGCCSASTTPTPANSKTSPLSTKTLTYDFAWPTTRSTPTSTGTLNRNPTPPCTTVCSDNAEAAVKKPNPSHSNQCVTKLIATSTKRGIPCPNIDVRQIPLEQNQPPPRSSQLTKEPLAISLNSASSQSNQNRNAALSFIPAAVASTLQAEPSIPNLNADISIFPSSSTSISTQPVPVANGYSISPIPATVSASAASLGSSVINSSSYQFANILPMQMPNTGLASTSSGNLNSTILIPPSLSRSITISMVGQSEGNTNPSSSVSTQPTSSTITLTSSEIKSNAPDSLDPISEKSPLQLVQDVVDRYQGGIGESRAGTRNQSDASDESPASKNDSVSTTAVIPKCLTAEAMAPIKEEMKPKIVDPVSTSTGFVQKTMAITSNATLTSIDTDAERRRIDGGIIKLEMSLPSISIFPASSSISISQPALQPMANLSSNNTNSCITTTSMSANVPIMAHTPLLTCTNTGSGFNLTNLSANGSSLILQQQQDQNNQNSLFATASTTSNGQQIRYPVFQTLQPIILNSNGTQGQLIISPQSQGNGMDQSFIQLDQNQSHHQTTADVLQHQGTTMVIDPSMCGQNILCGGPKKKKKRLSKKQQQQQAQLQLQQQLLLQQLHQQVQAQQVQAAQQQIPLLFPPSFSLGQQGFSLQPMNMNMNMNFFPTPTILTLPNIILNPADGTLFIQQPSGTPLGAATTTAGSNIKLSNQFPIQTLQPQQQNLIAPKKENSGIIEVRVNEMGLSVDDSRQNATPDSSTNDCQLGLATSTPNSTNSITVSLPLSSSTNLQTKKLPLKSKAVSSSSNTVKRILPQKQILPKIDSTTQSNENA